MPLILADRVNETTTTAGTGTVTLAGAVDGYQSFAVIGDGNTTYYTIAHQTANQWEVGIGTYTASGTTLSRDTVLASSSGGGLVNFSAGTKFVFCDYPAGKAINQDEVGNTFVPNLGATTPSSGVFTTLTGNSTSQFGRSSANYFQAVGAAANLSPEISVLGSDTNIPFTIESKGTGAVNLVPGSRGVNVSNGGTVTAITASASGASYTSIPTLTIAAPTTAGGVQATANALMFTSAATVAGGGTGYTLNDVLTIVGGTTSGAVGTYTVTGVTGGVITSVSRTAGSGYSVLPSNPVSVTGGTGSGATLNLLWVVSGATITNAGSGYVEQPTVTFSGGGGSGAAAYASVGSMPIIRGLAGGSGGSNGMSFHSASGEAIRITDSGGSNVNYWRIQGAPSLSGVQMQATGSDTNVGGLFSTKGTSGFSFYTNAFAQEQLRVSHTASAVNYVQVTGNATTSRPVISAQGSDSNVGLNLASKGNRSISLLTNSVTAFEALSPASSVNYLTANGAVTSSPPSLAATGTDTNIDLSLTSKGAGAVNLNTGGGTQVKVIDVASAVNYWRFNGNVINGGPRIYVEGSDTNINYVISTKGSGAHIFRTASEASEAFRITHTASAVNYVQVTGGATGNPPVISVAGSDANINFPFNAKGTGVFIFTSNGGEQFRVQTIANAVNNIQVFGNTSGFAPTLISRGTDTNVGLNLATKGTGTIALQTAGGTITQFEVTDTASAVNFVRVTGAATGVDPVISAQGSDSSRNLRLTAKGTGGVQSTSRFDAGVSGANYLSFSGAVASAAPSIATAGSDTNIGLNLQSKGTGAINLQTAGGTTQLAVTDTASAVNYAQITGAVTGNAPAITAVGSDSNVDIRLIPKGTGVSALMDSAIFTGLRVGPRATNGDSFFQVQRNVGYADLQAIGATNADLKLTPNGTGLVRFGTYVAGALTATGYINIKAADGTTYKVLVST